MGDLTTVAAYLTQRLEEMGLTHVFAVPGDYTGELLTIIDTQSKLQRVACCNELNAAYAADGYARYNGLAALCVTSGVGALSAINGVGGSYAEYHPVIVIVGTLSTSSGLKESVGHRLFHHQLELRDTNLAVYRAVTAHQESITNAGTAPAQIDAALTAALVSRRPVLIEISEDCCSLPCAARSSPLSVPKRRYTDLATLRAIAPRNKHAAEVVESFDAAVAAIAAKWAAAKKPILWFGHEIATYGLRDEAATLLETTRAPFVTSLLGKSVLGEARPGFLGVHEGVFTPPSCEEFLREGDLLVALGVWNTDINMLGVKSARVANPADVLAVDDVVWVGEDTYFHVELGALLAELARRLAPRDWVARTAPRAFLHPRNLPPDAPVTFDAFFGALDVALDGKAKIVADIGISANGASAWLRVDTPGAYQAQGIWASIGWSTPAGFGASFADDRRTFVIVGDGAFKLTCQELSSMARYRRDIVVFVMNNGVYGVEQMFLDPTPYRKDSTTPFEAANVLQRWDYQALMAGLSGADGAAARSAVIGVFGDLARVLGDIAASGPAAWLVEVRLAERDYPSAWNRIIYGDGH